MVASVKSNYNFKWSPAAKKTLTDFICKIKIHFGEKEQISKIKIKILKSNIKLSLIILIGFVFAIKIFLFFICKTNTKILFYYNDYYL